MPISPKMFPTEGSHMMNNNHYPQLCYGNQFQFPLPQCILPNHHHHPYGYGPSFPCNGGGIPFPPQVGCHGCCSNGYLPSCPHNYCSFRPPYLPHISPSCLPCNGPYFPYPSPYPTAYFVPGYSLPDPIRYNNDQVESCSCGCPNHLKDNGGAQITNEKNPSDPMVVPNSYPLTQFPCHPYPVFWHPSKGTEGCSGLPKDGFVQNEEETGNVKEMNEYTDKQSSRPESDQQELPKCKIIPVLQLESSVDDESSVPEKGTKNGEVGNGEQKKEILTSDHNSGKQSSSLVKLPKFSPICLRVDPLPKKDTNSSRSSSTASKKKKNQIETPEGKDLPQSLPVKRKEISVVWDECGSGNKVDISNPIKKINLESTGVDPNSKDKNNEEEKEEKIGELQDKHLKLSEVEAAVMIQATYKGFLVRRWEPLKKLKQIRKVCEKIDGIKSRIARLEASSLDQLDEKEKVLIGETIMNSLLQLDTIQGLHPSVREIRKSVVKELVNLQEKLDFLTDVNSNCNVESVEKNPNDVKSDVEESADDDKIMAEPASLESNFQELEESPVLPTQNITSFDLGKLQEQNLSEIGCVLHSESTVETELTVIHEEEEEEECKIGEAEVLHQMQEEKLVEPCADNIKVLELVPEKKDGTDSPPSNEIEDQDEKQEYIMAEAPKPLEEGTLEISAANKVDDAITMVADSTVENSSITMEEPADPIPMDQASAKELELRDQDQNLMDGNPKSLEEGTQGNSAANKKDHVITREPYNPIPLDQDQNFMGGTDADPPKSLEEGTHEISAANMEDVISMVEASTAENNSAADPIPINLASIEKHEPTDQSQIFIGETEGNEKTNVRSALNSRVKKLEKKLGCKKRLKMKSLRRRSAGFRPYRLKRSTLRNAKASALVQ